MNKKIEIETKSSIQQKKNNSPKNLWNIKKYCSTIQRTSKAQLDLNLGCLSDFFHL